MYKSLFTLVLTVLAHFASAQTAVEPMPQASSKAPFTLIALPYATNALAPIISQQTVELHYGKHLQGYVNNVNKLTKGTEWEQKTLLELVREAKGALYNNAGQLLNHNIYFTTFSPKGGGEPQGALAEAIVKKWGSVDAFRQEMEREGNALFGSGWVWLASNAHGELSVVRYANGGNPIRDGLTPLLGFDVWEHAYYLDYQNRRADHLKSLWKLVNWRAVESRYAH